MNTLYIIHFDLYAKLSSLAPTEMYVDVYIDITFL